MSDKKPSIKIQAGITGYGGKTVTLLGALDPDSGLFIVAKEVAADHREEGAVVVSNDPRAQGRDSLFTEDKLQDAIRIFFRMKSTGMLELLTSLTKYDPEHKIDVGAVDEGGTRYRLAPDISNGHVAVLAMAEAANRSYTAQEMADFSAEIADMFASI